MDAVLLWTLVGLSFILIPLLLGLMISPYQQATRVELIKADPEQVWNTLSDLSRQGEWRTDLKNIQFKDDDEGMRWVEQPSHGRSVVVRKLKEVEHKELLLQLNSAYGVKGTREAVLRPVPGGTRVTFKESSEIKNPWVRLATQLSSNLDKRLNKYIGQFKAKFGAV